MYAGLACVHARTYAAAGHTQVRRHTRSAATQLHASLLRPAASHGTAEATPITRYTCVIVSIIAQSAIRVHQHATEAG